MKRSTRLRRKNIRWDYNGDGRFAEDRIKGEDKRYWRRRVRRTILAALVAVFLCLPIQAWEPVGYSAEVTAALKAACYDPSVIGTSHWTSPSVFAYDWQEPQNNAQKFVWALKSDPYTLTTALAVGAPNSTKNLGQWLQATGRALTANPWANGYIAYDYYTASVDRIAYRIALLAKNSAGYNMADPAVSAAVNVRTDTNMSVYFGAGSGTVFDKNGILVPNAYGYAVNQPGLPSSWVKPADCQLGTPALSTPTPAIVNPTPTATPSGTLKCKNPTTGLCETPPGIFGGGCPAGWVQCGTPPPVVTPIPSVVTPIPGATVACLSSDGRYCRVATACAEDETPLRK